MLCFEDEIIDTLPKSSEFRKEVIKPFIPKKSDFKGSKKLIDQLLVFCKKYCQKSNDLLKEIENSLKK